MLGWLRHKGTPVPDDRPVESDDQKHTPEVRLGRLLDRLGTDSHAAATVIEATLREITPSPRTDAAAETPSEIAPPPTPDGRPAYVAGVDPDDYREALPLLRRAMAAVGGNPDDDSDTLASKIVGALRDRHGFTPDLLSDISPYLEQFVRDVHAGVVRLEADDAEAGGEVAAASTAEITAPPPRENVILDEPAEETRDITPPDKTRGNTAKVRAVEVPPVAEPAAAVREMRVIAVCSQKGGAGKTTIAAHLAVSAGLAGHGPAVLIDTDPQGSLGEWWRARHEDAPALAKVTLDDLAANLAELRSYGTAIAIIDTPPALTGAIEQVIAVADLVLIPARPSPHDLRAVGATVEMARRAGKPFLFVVNGAAPRASITAQAVAALSEHGRVVPVILYQRTDFAASMIDGRTVVEVAASSRSAQEIADLWQYVYEQISMRVAA